MDYIKKLISDNEQKLTYLDKYLSINEMAIINAGNNNISSIKELVQKKQALITSINIIDDKIIQNIANTKDYYKVDDLGELLASEIPELVELKNISTEVLKKMLEVKNSDKEFLSKTEKVFDDYKDEKGPYDRKKLEYYTKNFFE